MDETETEPDELQALLDRSIAGANEHLKAIVIPGKRTLTARDLATELTDVVCVLNVATVTSKGEPRLSAVDGHFLRGRFYFTTDGTATKARHLRARPSVSVGYTPRDGFGVWAHGTAAFLDRGSPEWTMVDDHATLMYGVSPTTFGDGVVIVRVDPIWMVAFAMTADEQLEMAESLAAREQRLAARDAGAPVSR